MTKETTKNKIHGDKIWDEILKAIVNTMPEQLFPLFKEVYGREYPEGTPIILLSTEFSTYLDHPKEKPSSRFTDISLLVNSTDYYHLECQMKNDSNMVFRMISYDLHFAIQYCSSPDEETNEMILHFPSSVVIYPDQNESISDKLTCHIYFPDSGEYIYKIPTIKVQSYSLEEIHEKQLRLFLPYTLLRLRPRLSSKKYPLTRDELTHFVNDIIVILDDDLKNGYITHNQHSDYINLFRFAADQVFRKNPEFKEEVFHMTEPLIILPSVQLKQQEEQINEMSEQINEMSEQLNAKDALIAELQAKLSKNK